MGDPVLYTVTVTNAGPVPLISGVSLVDDLPRGFRYLPGSARLEGAPREPVIDASGTSLTWPLGDLGLGESRVVTYVTVASVDALEGDGRNVATATGTFPGGGVGVASDVAVVSLEGGPFANRSVILGRVFVDENADGAFTPGERGLAGVRLVLDDGVTVLTDRDGLYHIEGVTPGVRAFRLDESTLPPGHTPVVLDSQNALNPSSRFLDLRFGVLHRANFAVLPPADQIVRIEKTPPTDAVLLEPSFLSENGVTHVVARWNGEARPTHRIDLNTGTVSVFFPGMIKTGRKTNQPVDELNVDRYRIHTDHDAGYTRLDIRLRKRTSGYPADYVRVAPAGDGELRISVGGAAIPDDDEAARASAAVETAIHAVGTPEPAAELAALQGPVVHEPAEGTAFISRDKISVRVSAHLASAFELYVNDQPVSKEQIGEKSIHVKARRSFYEYVSVPIEPGPNKLRFETKGPSAQETGVVELTVFRAADPEKIELEVADDQLVADGRTEPVVGVSLRDRNGLATGESTVITVEISGGQILSPDFRPMEPGHQVQIREGRALLRLSAANQAETRIVTVIAGRLRHRADLVLRPALRDWILVGSADATASLTESREAASRTRALREETRETIESGLRVFGQGRFVADTLLTFSYDSERAYDDYPIFRQFQEDDYYPVYGDTSKIFPEAASRAKLYARLEKEQSYLMFGDIDTEMQETELAAHSRRLTGAKADIKTDWIDFKGFASHTEQARVREEIPAGGVSYYQLRDRDVIPGSDEIWLEVRDRARPSEVLRREQLSRGRDYSFDYSFGRILFKRPITSRDEDFNPQVIVVNYEKDGRTGDKQYTFGGRPALHDPDRRVTVGATYLEEENGFFSDKVEGVDATVKLDEKTALRGEYAETNTLDEGFGRGHLVELKREEEKTSYRVYHSDLDDTFDNPGLRGSPVGRRLTGAEAVHYFTPRVSGELEAYDQIDVVGGRTLRVGVADMVYEGDNYKLGAGGGYVTQEEDASSSLGAAERESPLLRLQAGYAFNSRIDIEGEYQHAFGDRDTEQPTRGAVTVGYQVFENTRLLFGVERRYVTGEGMADNLLLGTEVTVNDYVSVFNKYELDAGQSGQAGRANSGVAFKYPLRPDLRVDLTAEANNTVHETGRAPIGREFWSLASGFEYTPSDADHTLVGRHEYKWQPDRREHFNELGGTVKVLDDHTAFARNRLSFAEVTSPDQYDEWIARVLFGWAYRPLFEDRLNVISSLEFNYERTASANLARIQDVLSSHEFTYQTAPDWIIEGKYAVKAAWGDFLDDTVWTDVKALRLRHDFTKRFYGAVGARLLSQYETEVHTLGYGVEAGCIIRKDFIIALGWNFEGFHDRRFSAGDHWEQGAYVAFRVKFDESLFGVLRQLRGRANADADAAGSSTAYNLNAAPSAP
ncbi:MAG: hypothetical protein MUE42_01020 [Opitutaceae bacterium]|nr:hypothetical protein [Opitutaceae bacterium]